MKYSDTMTGLSTTSLKCLQVQCLFDSIEAYKDATSMFTLSPAEQKLMSKIVKDANEYLRFLRDGECTKIIMS